MGLSIRFCLVIDEGERMGGRLKGGKEEKRRGGGEKECDWKVWIEELPLY
jgi:hypothetical protein